MEKKPIHIFLVLLVMLLLGIVALVELVLVVTKHTTNTPTHTQTIEVLTEVNTEVLTEMNTEVDTEETKQVTTKVTETTVETTETTEIKNIDDTAQYEDISNNNTTYLGNFMITHYCPCSICNGQYTTTALGTPVTPYRTIAVDPSIIPLGSIVMINGYNYIAEDTGGDISGYHIDLCVGSHYEANDLGVIHADVYLVG